MAKQQMHDYHLTNKTNCYPNKTLKENIAVIDGNDLINNLNPVTFQFKNDIKTSNSLIFLTSPVTQKSASHVLLKSCSTPPIR